MKRNLSSLNAQHIAVLDKATALKAEVADLRARLAAAEAREARLVGAVRRVRAAVAAETERCAAIADGYTKRITQIYGATNATAGALDACAGISRAIREAPPPQEGT